MLRRIPEFLYERWLLQQIHHSPRHIAIIQDGNRRFASSRGIKIDAGHRAGADKAEQMFDWTRELGVTYVTLYCFSTENFNRESAEVQEIFNLFKERFTKALTDDRVHRYRIRIQMVGERSRLPEDLKAVIGQAEETTALYQGYFHNYAIAYGGRNEIIRATRSILGEVQEGKYQPDQIDRSLVEQHICADHNLPPVDLVIRTANEYRTSNFLPWLTNGHESAVYFCAPYWPLFRKIDFLRAIRVYSQRIDARLGLV
jgi:tritrans,polycis-undecaprenyl-diphosphate synthase [geranylgeranyl-diphosphate specific]